MQTIAIKYVGKKPSKVDNVAETGLVWLPGQVHEVPVVKAAIMLQHPDVWAADKPISPQAHDTLAEVAKAEIEKQKKARDKEDEKRDIALVKKNLGEMKNKTEIIDYAKKEFGIDLDPREKRAQLERRVLDARKAFTIAKPLA